MSSVRQVSSLYNHVLLESHVSCCQMIIEDYVIRYYLCITALFYSLPSLSCDSSKNI